MSDPYQLAAAVLAAAVAAETAASLTPPDERFVICGELAWDGVEMLAVQIGGVRTGLPQQPGLQRAEVGVGFTCDMTVHLVRCFPSLTDSGDAPASTAMNDASRDVATEAWTVYDALFGQASSNELADGATVVVGQLVFVGAEGGFVDATIPVAVELL